MQEHNIDTISRRCRMKWVAIISNTKRCEIEHDPEAGYYLYIFKNNECIKDYLQDTLEIAMEIAQEEYDVSRNSWKKSE